MAKNKIIYQFKITLLDTKPAIWRRIQVPEDYLFWELHVAIQSAMGWEDAHLHKFLIGKDDRIIINGNPVGSEFVNRESLNGWETSVDDFMFDPGDVAMYEYDMGDDWVHEVLLEGVFLKEKGTKYPRCVGGERACPPEDCGGVPGYERLLEVLASPEDPEREDIVSWLGREYDPEEFDFKAVKFANPRTQWKRWQI